MRALTGTSDTNQLDEHVAPGFEQHVDEPLSSGIKLRITLKELWAALTVLLLFSQIVAFLLSQW